MSADLFEALDEALEDARRCINDMRRLNVEKAEAQKAYSIAKRQRILYERDHNNTPVSIIGDVVKGYEDIAQLAFERDCAEAVCDANYEAALFHKKRADIIAKQIDREWSQSGYRG